MRAASRISFLTLGLFGLLLLLVGSAPLRGRQGPSPLQSRITIAPANEPGEQLVVSGVVYGPDGLTPAAGVMLEIHHTDAEGWYHKASRNRERARLQATLQTDAQGRFEFRTIKPGKYPEGRNPAHIHFRAWGSGFGEQFPTELYFAGDPDLPPAANAPRSGKWNAVCSPRRDASGLLHCTYNIKLDK